MAVLTDPRLSVLASHDAINAMALQSLRSWNHGIFVASLFWGLWLLPLGYLVLRSRMQPRIFSVLLMLVCAGYVMNCFGERLLPGYSTTTFSEYVTIPASLGEIGLCLWLLLVGARPRVAGDH